MTTRLMFDCNSEQKCIEPLLPFSANVKLLVKPYNSSAAFAGRKVSIRLIDIYMYLVSAGICVYIQRCPVDRI